MHLSNTKTVFILSILLISLFFRETPYLNILVANKIWLVYIFLFLFLFPPKKGRTILYVSIFLLIFSLILTLLNFINLAEFFGIVIYFLLWAAVIVKVFSLRESQ
ncbi:MAG: hypothetical protein A3F31_04850 [Candidatus Levybacteria bacterium RIFCSPHIGHO2_12_FULL_38_12]|nr:MAG: hypothetical protein A2770_04535 [Candidatus Levybacteria bacterium RIFCSPHIGHO2_01_FULL_38_12]OGH21762.1 MAG: hypothetical protein A3D75_01055 [Candidatus Levybacteria bacterium RIFCSPHIGHO2_02_FULL_37_18]OGH22580.1 MAG: hypothetical protein A3F31_04850 [Candidatus Levybacteria bacterium RIFCSPHIGHO2_12_FULL_38_12]OGH33383.1 MAG: hypothetical protein A3A47_04005 [Candidatus Levybacteria bacterium RIFCSPLOWO2_01_FULL_37_20]OGH44118.1 MAG: hypothetical protein A3J14_05220 [Candidatus Lev